ncbi:unnamed protein product, partial [Mycena citricolor]
VRLCALSPQSRISYPCFITDTRECVQVYPTYSSAFLSSPCGSLLKHPSLSFEQ